MENTDKTTMTSQANTSGQATFSPSITRMPGLQQVNRQVADLRQTLSSLMMDKQYADGEIISASAVLDAQLEDYLRTISDKRQPGMRTF